MVLYHYCSNDAFLGILESKSVWASEFTLSNDALEGKWIRVVVAECLKRRNIDTLTSAPLMSALGDLIELLGAAGFCLSSEGDQLSQWRAYADDGRGVSVGFDDSIFGNDGPLPSLVQVEYDLEKQVRIVDETIDRLVSLLKRGAGRIPTLLGGPGINQNEKNELDKEFRVTVFSLFPYLYNFKNAAFSEEKEWRALVNIVSRSGGSLSAMIAHEEDEESGPGWLLHKMQFRAKGDRIIPYRPMALGKKLSIRSLYLGPKNITPIQIYLGALHAHGFGGVDVKQSRASYR